MQLAHIWHPAMRVEETCCLVGKKKKKQDDEQQKQQKLQGNECKFCKGDVF